MQNDIDHILDWICEKLAKKTGLSPKLLQPNVPLSQFGIDSGYAVELSGELAEKIGREISPTIFLENGTLAELRQALSIESQLRLDECTATQDNRDIAIVGMACRLPGADNLAEFWSNLKEGRDAIRPWPKDRWQPSADDGFDFVPNWGGFVDGIFHFDAEAFGIGEIEALHMDPQQRLLLMVAVEALEDAGVRPEALVGRQVGVYVGASESEYGATLISNARAVHAYSGTGNALSVIANRLSYVLGLRGPSMAVDTACSSSLVACHLAMQAIRSGQVDQAIVGGVNALLSPAISAAFAQAGMLAPEGRCRAFSDDAEGYVRSEGCGVVVLKPYQKAIDDGDAVYAIIKGSAVNQDGRSSGLTAPNKQAQVDVIRAACKDAGIDPSQITYVEAHGTGTRLGDPIEAAALGAAYGARRSHKLRIGSVKTNVGHLEAAAGIAGLIKSALMLGERTLVPSLHFDAPNPLIDFPSLSLQLVEQSEELGTRNAVYTGLSSFGFGGTNAHVILATEPERQLRPVEISVQACSPMLLLSAKSNDQLKSYCATLVSDLNTPRGADLTGVSNALNRLEPQPFRKGFLANNLDVFKSQIKDWLSSGSGAVRRGTPHLLFVFPGQGVRWQDFVGELVSHDKDARRFLRRCQRALQKCGEMPDLLSLVSGDKQAESSAEDQILAFIGQSMFVNYLAAHSVRPSHVVGHSLGEIAAAHAAKAIGLESCLRLILLRAQMLEHPNSRGMTVALGIGEEAVWEVVSGIPGLSVAAVNGKNQTTLAAKGNSASALLDRLKARKIAYKTVSDRIAFHSPLDEDRATEFLDLLGNIAFARDTDATIISSVTGDRIAGRDLDRDYWLRNLVEPVLFDKAARTSLESFAAESPGVVIEIAPQPVLTPLFDRLVTEKSDEGATIVRRPKSSDPIERLRELCVQLWESGVDVVDAASRETPYGPIRLPPRPWSLRRFRFENTNQAGSTTKAMLDRELGIGMSLVPFTQAVRSVLDQHRVDDIPIVPATAQILLMSSMLGDLGHDKPIALRNCRFLRPVLVEDELSGLRLSAKIDRDEQGRITLSTELEGGKVETATDADWSFVEPEKLLAQFASEPLPKYPKIGQTVDLQNLYQSLEDVGLQYGPSFRRIVKATRLGDKIVLELGSPSTTKAGWQDNSAAFDSALHTIAPLVQERLGEPERMIPRGFKSFTCLRPIKGIAHAQITLTEKLDANITLYDQEEQPLAMLEGLSFHRTPKKLDLDNTEGDLAYYETRWVAQDSFDTNAQIDNLLIVADCASRARQLVSESAGRLAGVCIIVRGEKYSDGGSEITVNGIDREDYLKAITAFNTRSGHPITKVVMICDNHSEEVAKEVSKASALFWGISFSNSDRCKILFLSEENARHKASRAAQSAAALQGLARCVPFENPLLNVKCVTVVEALPSTIADNVIAELESDDDNMEIRIASGKRFVKRLIRLKQLDKKAAFKPRVDATYIVTGGNGGIGQSVVTWLAQNGAGRIIATGRREAESDYLHSFEQLADSCGAVVQYRQCDCADPLALAALHAEASDLRLPVCGVFHAAGVLGDGAMLDQNYETISRVIRPKVDGLSAIMQVFPRETLDVLAVFSSVAATIGSPGQASYCAANAAMERLAADAKLNDWPIVSVGWGPWSESGMAAGKDAKNVQRVSDGVKLIDHVTGVQALQRVLGCAHHNVIITPFELEHLTQFYPEGNGFSLFDGLFSKESEVLRSAGRSKNVSERRALRDYAAPENEIEEVVQGMWQRILSVSLVGVTDNFFEMGGDSVMGNQFMIDVKQRFGVRISAEDVFKEFTIRFVAKAIEDKLVSAINEMNDDEIESRLVD